MQMAVSSQRLLSLHLTLLTLFRAGKFGCVFKAHLNEQEVNGVPSYIVAVKTGKAEASDKEKTELLMEAVIMAQFSHDNIVNLIGHCISDMGLVMVVVQYCEYGSLSAFLAKNDREVVDGMAFKFGFDVARGMDFITSLGFVHRDLAVRRACACAVHVCVHVCVCACVRIYIYIYSYIIIYIHMCVCSARWDACSAAVPECNGCFPLYSSAHSDWGRRATC
jgi:hypothetical protein